MKKATKSLVTISIIAAMSFGGAAGAQAAAVPPSHSTASSTTSTIAPSSQRAAQTGTVAPAPLSSTERNNTNGTKSVQTNVGTPAAVPIAIRLAVKAGMQVLKRTNVKWYNAIRTQLNKGRTVFVNWWNTKVPAKIKNVVYATTGGLGGNALYDTLLWVVGL
ncbi:hypothetical protein ACNPM8_00370 [Glutamicibacter sp. AGC46]